MFKLSAGAALSLNTTTTHSRGYAKDAEDAQVIQVQGGGSPMSFLTRITCFSYSSKTVAPTSHIIGKYSQIESPC